MIVPLKKKIIRNVPIKPSTIDPVLPPLTIPLYPFYYRALVGLTKPIGTPRLIKEGAIMLLYLIRLPSIVWMVILSLSTLICVHAYR
jgi:hypothetical protein